MFELAEVLRLNTPLYRLDAGTTNVSLDNMFTFAEALMVNYSISNLSIKSKYCEFLSRYKILHNSTDADTSEELISKFCEVPKANKTLTSLRLYRAFNDRHDLRISQRLQVELLQSLKHNSSITELRLGCRMDLGI